MLINGCHSSWSEEGGWMQRVGPYERDYRLIYWKEILWYSFEFMPQIRSSSITIGSK